MIRILFLIFFLFSCKKETVTETKTKRPVKTVKVAALQYYSRMGEKEYNFNLFKKLATEAAEKGSKIIVLPEAALTGYMDPGKDKTWTSSEGSEDEIPIQGNAEPLGGKFIAKYLAEAKRLKVYLTIPFVEEDDGKFYNSVLLSSPKGEILIHHRKKSLWTHGDSGWCEQGDLKPVVANTEYGKLGLMICFDVHSMPQILSKLKVDIVLYSVGWFGPNTEDWYKRRFPNKYVIPNDFSVIAANWSHEKGQESWPGCGWSNIVFRNGVVLRITPKTVGEEIVYAKVPIN